MLSVCLRCRLHKWKKVPRERDFRNCDLSTSSRSRIGNRNDGRNFEREFPESAKYRIAPRPAAYRDYLFHIIAELYTFMNVLAMKTILACFYAKFSEFSHNCGQGESDDVIEITVYP